MSRGGVVSLMVLTWAASFSSADVDDLVRRAKTRIDHGNYEGARTLLDQALAEDPTNTPALLLVVDIFHGREASLRYLQSVQPFDLIRARRVLGILRASVAGTSREACLAQERASLVSSEFIEPVSGPPAPWERSRLGAPDAPPCGPLRGEAFGTIADAELGAPNRIVERFDQERVWDAVCWAHMAVVLRRGGEVQAAESALSRAVPASAEDWIEVASDALIVSSDPYAWWQAHRGDLRQALKERGPRSCQDWSLLKLAESLRTLCVARSDIESLVLVAEMELMTHAPGSSYDPVRETVEALERFLPLAGALPRLDWRDGPEAACLRAGLQTAMGEPSRAIETLEAADRVFAESLPIRTRLWRLYRETGRSSDRARTAESIAWSISAGRHVDWEFVRPLVRDLRETDAVAAVETVRGWLGDPRCDSIMGGVFDISVLGDDGPRLLDDLAAWARRRDEPSYAAFPTVLYYAVSSGRVELAREALARMPAAWIGHLDNHWSVERAPELSATALRPLVWSLASQERLSDTEDAFLRMFSSPALPWGEPRIETRRLFRDLVQDPEFRGLPGGAYVLSLLLPMPYCGDAALALRREACQAGFRSRGLVRDLAMPGEPLLEGSAQVDPVGTRLAAAMRADGMQALARFVQEEDKADRDLLDLARRELARRARGIPNAGAAPPKPVRDATSASEGAPDGEGEDWDTTSATWMHRVVLGGEGEPPVACERLFSHVPYGRETYRWKDLVLRLAEALATVGRAEDAARCVDVWAGRCGWLDPEDRREGFT